MKGDAFSAAVCAAFCDALNRITPTGEIRCNGGRSESTKKPDKWGPC